MNLPLHIIDPLHYPGWDRLLLEHPDHSFFHCSHWARVLQKSYRFRPLYITRIERGKLQVLVPLMEVDSMLTGKRGVGLPFTDYCEPILPLDGDWPAIMNILAGYGKLREWRTIEVRGGAKLPDQWPCSSFYFKHSLDLTQGEKTLQSGLNDSTRQNIKKAVREGVSITITRTEEAIKEFYRLNCMTRKDNGLPPQPYRFFSNLHEEVIVQGHGFIALARHGSTTAAAAVFLHFGNEALYKYGASDKTFQHLRANNLLLWEAIQWCSRTGFSTFCLGRTRPENTGLRQFKAGWGAKEHIVKYYRFNIRKKMFVQDRDLGEKFYSEIFRLMPAPLLKMAGKALYLHVE